MSAAALAHLYEHHRAPVVGALARRCPWVAPVDRESLYHDAYTAVLERERIGTLEPERMHPRELRAYLVKSAIHKALDERKSAERRLTVPLDLASHDRADGGPPLDEAAIRALDAATVRELVDELPARGQAVLRLRFLHELEPTEIQSLLRISRRAYRKELERAVRQIASRYELVRSGRWHETRRSLVLAYVAGVTGPRRTRMARQHLAACPDCAQRAVELRRAAERVAAVVPLPALTLDYAPLQRIVEAAAGAKSSVSELGSGAKQQLGSLVHRVSDPTPLAGARPGAVAAAIGGCLVLGGGATYCAVEGLPDVISAPLAVEEPHPSRADSKPAHERPAQRLKEDAGITAEPDPVPLEARRPPTEAPFGSFTHAVTEEGVPFSFRVPITEDPRDPYSDAWETFSSIPTEKSAGGPISLNKSMVGAQDAEAIIFWTSFPDGDYADPCARLWSPPVGSSAADLAAGVATAPGTELVTGPSNVTLGGRPAKHVALTVRENVGCDPGFFYSWRDAKVGALWRAPWDGDTIRVWIVDVDGTRLFIEAVTRQAAGGQKREVEQIVESIRFD